MLSHPLSHAGSKNIYIDIDHTIIKYHQFPMTNGKLARMTNRKAQANQHIAKNRQKTSHPRLHRRTCRSCSSCSSIHPECGWEMKNCTPLWREAHLQVQMYKTHQVRTAFGSWDVEKVHAVVTKHSMLGTPLEVEMLKKCTALWREVRSPNVQNTPRSAHFWTLKRRFAWPAQGILHKTWWFCSSFQSAGRREAFEEDLQRCMSCGRRSTRDTFIRDVRRSGLWFPERGCILEHQIFRFAKMNLRGRCTTSCDLASFFRGRSSTLDRLVRGHQLCTQVSIFEGSLAE